MSVLLSWTTGPVQILGVRPVSGDIKHKQWIGIALIAKYNKCARISPGDMVTSPPLPPLPLLHFLPSVRQVGERFASDPPGFLFFPSPSGLHFPLGAFIWLCLREVFGQVWLPASLPLFYSYTISSGWRLSVNIKKDSFGSVRHVTRVPGFCFICWICDAWCQNVKWYSWSSLWVSNSVCIPADLLVVAHWRRPTWSTRIHSFNRSQ